MHDTAIFKLLKLTFNPEVKAFELHPKDLALKYIKGGTKQRTYNLLEKIKDIGLPAKEICQNILNHMHSNESIREAFRILKNTPLEDAARETIEQIAKYRQMLSIDDI